MWIIRRCFRRQGEKWNWQYTVSRYYCWLLLYCVCLFDCCPVHTQNRCEDSLSVYSMVRKCMKNVNHVHMSWPTRTIMKIIFPWMKGQCLKTKFLFCLANENKTLKCVSINFECLLFQQEVLYLFVSKYCITLPPSY